MEREKEKEKERERERGLELPDAFVRRMERLLGEEYPAFAAGIQKERVFGLRLNGLKGEPERLEADCRAQFTLEPVPWESSGFYYADADRPGKHPYHEAGLYYIQEPSAMAAAGLLDVHPGETILDLCAAPGGKSTQIAAALQGKGLLLCNEIHPSRAKILSGNIERMGVSNAVVTNQDAQSLAGWLPEFFDKILVDAPCSGEGMFRKEPLARSEWTPETPRSCGMRQREILDYAAVMLKPGGLLVYSTCTFSPEENEGTLDAFLRKHPEFSMERRCGYSGFGKGRPQWVSDDAQPSLEYAFRLWPHRIKGEGHFLAALRKSGGKDRQREDRKDADGWGRMETGERRGQKNASKKMEKQAKQRPYDKGLEALFEQFCREIFRSSGPWEKEPGRYLLFGEQLYYVPQQLPEIHGKKVLRPGLHIGTFKKNRFEPAHALALYLKCEQVINSLDLDSKSEEILRYLRGESLPLKPDEKSGGWVLVTVDGYSIGWGKAAKNRLQNHYPRGLRLQSISLR